MTMRMDKQLVKDMYRGGRHWKAEARAEKAHRNYLTQKVTIDIQSNEAKEMWTHVGHPFTSNYMHAMTRLQRDKLAYGIDYLESFVVKSVSTLTKELVDATKRSGVLLDEAMDGLGGLGDVKFTAPTKITVKVSNPAIASLVIFLRRYDQFVCQIYTMYNMLLIVEQAKNDEIRFWRDDFHRVKRRMSGMLHRMTKKGTKSVELMREIESVYVSGIPSLSTPEAVEKARIIREQRLQFKLDKRAKHKTNNGLKLVTEDATEKSSKKNLDINQSTPDNIQEEKSGQESIAEMLAKLKAE